MTLMQRRTVLAGLAGAALAPVLPAFAHHGWSWTSPDWFELAGTVTDVYVGNPHCTLELDVDGAGWHVDLAPLSRTLNAGFDEGVVTPGDTVTAIGHRALDEAVNSMKAVRVIVGDAVYDVYPDRAANIPA